MRYLLFGISITMGLFAFGCRTITDYSVNVKWIYINETDHFITYEPNHVWNEFNVPPYDTVIYVQNSEGPQNVEATDFIPPINAKKVIIDSVLCDSILANELYRISNYQGTKLAERNFEFTFRFNDNNISLTDTCR